MAAPDIQSLMARTRLLAGVPAFKGIAYDALMCIAKAAREEEFTPGKIIIAEGEASTRLYIVVSGVAEASCKTAQEVVTLATFNRGDLFGEIALLIPNTPRTATVTAVKPLTLISYSSEDMDKLMAEYPNLRIILATSAKRLLLTNFIKKVSPFSVMNVGQIAALAEKIKTIAVPPRNMIIRQGERGNYCYLLKSGAVDVVLQTGETERLITTLYPGSLFGEAALLTGLPRSTSIRSRETSEVYAIGCMHFLDLVESDRRIASHMMELLQMRDRPRRKKDVIEQTMPREGRDPETVLKDPGLGHYYRLPPEGKFVWDLLDGNHSLRDLTLAYFEHFKAFSPQAIAEVVGGLGKAGFLESATWSTSVRRLLVRVPWFSQLWERLRKVLEFVIMRRHVDGWFTRVYQCGVKRLFSMPARLVFGAVALAGVFGFAGFVAAILPQLSSYALWQFGVWLIVPLLLSVVLHELGHGFAVKYFGREVMGVGVGWYWVVPIAFVDTSDMWLSDRWPRIIVNLAGVAANLVVVGLAMIPALILGPTHPYSVYAWVFSAVSYALVVTCLIPVWGTDGHYALSDYLAKN